MDGASSYNVYRGGVDVGSTSELSFTDSGLNPGTTYSYRVTSVTGEGIESKKSISVEVTTPPLEEDEGGGIFIPPERPVPNFIFINDDASYTNETKVSLFISAENAAQMAVSNEPDFSGVSWEEYNTQKEWVLVPGEGEKTVYVKFKSREGGVSDPIKDSITMDTTPPPSVKNLEGLASDGSMGFNWDNPDISDFSGVKVMRSEQFFPVEPGEDVEVFKGESSSFTDKGLLNGKRYYYTVFSYDEAGNYSSGAVVSGVPEAPLPPAPPPSEAGCLLWEVEPEEGEAPLRVTGRGEIQDPDSEVKSIYVEWGDGKREEVEEGFFEVKHTYEEPGVFLSRLVLLKRDGEKIESRACEARISVKERVSPPPSIQEIGLDDFRFRQNGMRLFPEEKELRVIADEPLETSIDYEVLPENLKTIMVTLKEGERSFSFLLRINEEKTFYGGEIYAPERAGVYVATIHIFDYKNQSIKKIEFFLEVIERKRPPQPFYLRLLLFLKRKKKELAFFLLLFLLLFLLAKRRKRKDEEDKRKRERSPSSGARSSPPR